MECLEEPKEIPKTCIHAVEEDYRNKIIKDLCESKQGAYACTAPDVSMHC